MSLPDYLCKYAISHPAHWLIAIENESVAMAIFSPLQGHAEEKKAIEPEVTKMFACPCSIHVHYVHLAKFFASFAWPWAASN